MYNTPLCVNIIDPEIVGNPNWLHNDVTTGVDIIELNDSDVSDLSDESPKRNLNHAWSYANNIIKQNNYKVNKKARERRRLENSNRQGLSSCEYTRSNFSDNIDMIENEYSNVRLNHQINCFTIINKHFIHSDTSSDNTDLDNTDKPIGDGFSENHDYNNIAEKETLAYSSDCDAEKRTIWIYSFKNKRLLSDDYMELVNIPSNESESCASFSFEKIEEDTDNITRAASPIPPPYIPRLNLSLGQTLSTVTEVTEPNKQLSSIETERLTKIPVIQKPKNTWLLNNNKENKDCVNNAEKSTNVVNWMGLSPRERRRVYRENDSISNVVYERKLGTLKELCPNMETKILKSQNIKDKEMYNDVHSKTVNVDVHVRMPKPSDTLEIGLEEEEISKQPDMNQTVVLGAENISEVMCKRKPQIKISQKCIINTKNITDPIEKLDTDNWIVEEASEDTIAYSYDLERIVEDKSNDGDYTLTANDRLWSKNAIALMKPAQWTEYAPIAESHLSLHLSLDSSIGKQTWLSRLINLFKCCNR